jgi:hypothetical protein
MWIAAPILPGTKAYSRAEALSQIAASPDYLICDMARSDEFREQAGLSTDVRSANAETIRK